MVRRRESQGKGKDDGASGRRPLCIADGRRGNLKITVAWLGCSIL